MSHLCEICGEPMPEDEWMFRYHGNSGPCPNPPQDDPRDEYPLSVYVIGAAMAFLDIAESDDLEEYFEKHEALFVAVMQALEKLELAVHPPEGTA